MNSGAPEGFLLPEDHVTRSIYDCIIITCVGTSNQGLQEKFCKAEQDCFGAPRTGRDFSQN